MDKPVIMPWFQKALAKQLKLEFPYATNWEKFRQKYRKSQNKPVLYLKDKIMVIQKSYIVYRRAKKLPDPKWNRYADLEDKESAQNIINGDIDRFGKKYVYKIEEIQYGKKEPLPPYDSSVSERSY